MKLPYSAKQMLIYGGIPLALIVSGIIIYANVSRSHWTATQDKLIKEGKIDQSTGSLVAEEGETRKYVEYRDKKYFLDGDFCMRSKLTRYPITIKRFNGAVGGEGPDGNTMYAVGDKNDPEYIDSGKGDEAKPTTQGVRDCWKRET